MRRLAIALATGTSLFFLNSAGYASDHLFTATATGGLTLGVSQPFLNGTNNNPGIPALSVPGQGSPLSGFDHMTPAVEIGSLPSTNANPGNGTFKTPPSVTAGKVAPSANSPFTACCVP
jgi:hypothetical protein